MMPVPANEETLAVARRVIWFEAPELALSDARRFLAYAFRYATHEDMQSIRRYLDDKALRDALAHAPPGIIDGRSWAYWRLMLDLPPCPLPTRQFA